MELYLQMGHGMQTMCENLIKKWGKGTVILSPVNMPFSKLEKYSSKIRSIGGSILFDPQLFFPKEANNKLKLYDYWPSENATLTDSSVLNKTDKKLLEINSLIASERIILPSLQMNEENFNKILKQTEESIKFFRSNSSKKLLATISLYPETIRNESFVEKLINVISLLDVDGYYVIPQPPNSEYIITDSLWMMGMLKLLTCLKFNNKEVVVGYSSHQGLLYSLANVDAIASGNFMNTRAFSPLKFKNKESGPMNKSTWFYVPHVMCEYKAIQLDVAKQRGILELFKPKGLFVNEDSQNLFAGAMPSSTNFKEPNSFNHYLHCLKIQCEDLKEETYEQTFSKYEFLLSAAETKLKEIKKYGISGQNRDFEDGIEVNRIAMISCKEDYGFKIGMEWK